MCHPQQLTKTLAIHGTMMQIAAPGGELLGKIMWNEWQMGPVGSEISIWSMHGNVMNQASQAFHPSKSKRSQRSLYGMADCAKY